MLTHAKRFSAASTSTGSLAAKRKKREEALEAKLVARTPGRAAASIVFLYAASPRATPGVGRVASAATANSTTVRVNGISAIKLAGSDRAGG